MCVHTTKNSTTNVGTNSGIYNQALYTIVLDWLEITLKQKDGPIVTLNENGEPSEVVALSDGVNLIRKKSRSGYYIGSKSYAAQYDVVLDGEPVAILHACNKFGKPELSQLKLLNHLLYTDQWQDVTSRVLNALHATINNITRLDIAIDGRGFVDQHILNREKCRGGVYRKVGKAKTNLQENSSYEVEGFNIGTRSSGKLLTGYAKGSLLIADKEAGKDHKPYIPEYWKANGLIQDDSEIEEIERLELKLSARSIGEIKELDLARLDDPSYLAGIFQVHCNNFYQWTEATDDSNTTRAKEKGTIEPIDWLYFQSIKVERVKVKKQPSGLWAVRMAIAFHMRENYVKAYLGAFEDNDKANVAKEYCTALAEAYGIEDWFYKKLEKWDRDQEYHSAIEEVINEANLRRAIYSEPMPA